MKTMPLGSRSLLFASGYLPLVFTCCLILATPVGAAPLPGTLDVSFNPGVAEAPPTLLVLPDGKILAGTVRLLTNGLPDPDFSLALPAGATIAAAALQPDGKILIAGEFLSVQGVPRPCIARVDTNGVLDLGFVPELMTTNPPPLPPPNLPADTTNHINVIRLLPDGSILLNGLKNILATNGVALPNVIRLNANGSRDESFGITNAGILGAVQPDGDIILIQSLSYNPWPGSSSLLRFDAAGHADVGFSPPDISGWVNAVALQDDKLIIGGNLVRVNGVRCGCLARLEANGTLDPSFNCSADSVTTAVSALVVQPDGKILIGGGFDFPNIATLNFARLQADGALDPTFATTGTDLYGYVFNLALQPDGKVLLGGDFTAVNGVTVPGLARVNGDATTGPGWITFDTADPEVVESTNSVLLTVRRVGGAEGDVSVSYATEDASATAGTDYSAQSGVIVFHPGETEHSIAIPLLEDTEIEDVETFHVILTAPTGGASLGPVTNISVNIQDNDGPASLDPTFAFDASGVDGAVQAIAVQTNGSILIGGTFQQVAREARRGVARLQADGSLDASFAPGAGLAYNSSLGNARMLCLQPDGKILIAGHFNLVDQTNRNFMARLNGDGSLDPDFDSGTGAWDVGNLVGDVREMAFQTNGQLIAGGQFSKFNGSAHTNLVRLDGGGLVDSGYAPASANVIMTLSVQPDGKLLYSGLANAGLGTQRVSRINADGSPDNLNLATANQVIWKVRALTNGNILLAGGFTNVNGTARRAIARLLPTGTVDAAFNPDLSAFVDAAVSSPYIYRFVPQDDGKVLIALKSYRSPAGNYLARLNQDGTLDTDFEPVRFAISGGDNDVILALAVQPDGHILVGGEFQTVNDLPHPYLVRLKGGGASGERQVAIKSLALAAQQSQLTLAVVAGKPFILQTSTDLTNWVSLSTNNVPVSTFTVVDSQVGTTTQRFYRIVQ
ncbi:MAG TPA: Calx-beta domain-containing protein [Dongiaceae bacterium]|nr:Calx-beta domain-containing protein [Dongiaceae bacterium]